MTSNSEKSRFSAIIVLVLMIVFSIHSVFAEDSFIFLDHINLAFHEFGHIFFGFLGEFVGFLGGTIMQLLIPIGIGIVFWRKGERAGAVFCLFWFGENFINIARYMADARDMLLPLVGGGEHDWNFIFAELDLLHYNTSIASGVKALGWLIMLASFAMLVILMLKQKRDTDQ